MPSSTCELADDVCPVRDELLGAILIIFKHVKTGRGRRQYNYITRDCHTSSLRYYFRHVARAGFQPRQQFERRLGNFAVIGQVSRIAESKTVDHRLAMYHRNGRERHPEQIERFACQCVRRQFWNGGLQSIVVGDWVPGKNPSIPCCRL